MVRISTVLYVVVALGLPPLANSEIVIDGRYDPDEDYVIGYDVNLNVEGVIDPVEEKGKLWYHYDYDPGSQKYCLSVVFVQPLMLVDNSYGANSIGWDEDAPSAKNHNFKDLKGSDKARFTITDGSDAGNVVFDFTLDYISEIDQGKDKGKGKDEDDGSGEYGSLGVAGGNGEVHTGDAAYLLEWSTSLDYNFNTLGHVLTEGSPAADDEYSIVDSAYSDWVFEVVYEFRVDGDVLGGNPLGGVTVPIVHDSPNKIGNSKVHPEIGELIEVEDDDRDEEPE